MKSFPLTPAEAHVLCAIQVLALWGVGLIAGMVLAQAVLAQVVGQ